ncbi:MAG TPA: SDR family oxidoreductase [Terrimicrobiaceae bacterium]
MKFYEGCTALITGASSGLGAEFSKQLAPYVRHLILVARRLERLERIKSDLEAGHKNLTVHVYGADLGSEEQRVALANWLPTQNLSVDFLINNAGLGDRGPFESSDWNRVKALLDVNAIALTHLTHLLLPSMTLRGRAAILNVSSVAGFFPLPNTAVYAATKAYVTSLSEALAIELGPRGITVTAVCPGPIETEFHAAARREGDEVRPSHAETMPKFVVTPEEAVRVSLLAVARGRPRVIPGTLLWVLVTVAAMVPFFVVRAVLRAVRNEL